MTDLKRSWSKQTNYTFETFGKCREVFKTASKLNFCEFIFPDDAMDDFAKILTYRGSKSTDRHRIVGCECSWCYLLDISMIYGAKVPFFSYHKGFSVSKIQLWKAEKSRTGALRLFTFCRGDLPKKSKFFLIF